MKQRVPITSKLSKFKGATQHYVVKLPKLAGATHYCPKIQRVPGTLGTRTNSSLDSTHDPNPYSLSILSSELADVTKIPDKLTMMSYLSQLYDCFRREIPASTAAEAGANMESIPEEEQTLGQMVAKKAARKRRSR